MAGVVQDIRVDELSGVGARLDAYAGLIDHNHIVTIVGAVVESQIRRRISDEKTSPDGKAWKAWKPDYAATRHSGHSLLQGEGDYLDSIFYEVSGDTAQVGSDLEYAAIHNFGGKAGRNRSVDIPARQSFGLSNDNEDEALDVVVEYLNGLPI